MHAGFFAKSLIEIAYLFLYHIQYKYFTGRSYFASKIGNMGNPASKSLEYKIVFIVTYYSCSGCLNTHYLMEQAKEKYTLQIV